jgi:WD40 repeat protein
MARGKRAGASVFLSHSSEDDELAGRLADLLTDDHYVSFLDHDPDLGIPGGRAWEDELYSKLRTTQALVFLATERSIKSQWVFAELVVARSVQKPIIPLSVGGARLSLLRDAQWIDWNEDETAIRRLRRALEELEVDALPFDPDRPPYPGLEAFDEDDAALFFGRRAEIAALMGYLHPPFALETRPFIAVTGPSGSGKSSLVRAGLIPRLRLTGRWIVPRPIVPRDRPIGELARALATALQATGQRAQWRDIQQRIDADPRELADIAADLVAPLQTVDGKVLIVIDQGEELVRSGDAGRELLALLAAAQAESTRLWVLITIRSEFLNAVLERSPIPGLVGQTMVLGPMDRSRLAVIILGPADRAGVRFDEGLVERMVEETEGGDALPLLAYTLRQLYERSLPQRRITEQLYDEVGGVLGALKDRADRVLEAFDQQGKAGIVLPTLMQLVELSPAGEPTRRRVRREALEPDQQAVLDAFIAARLLKSSREGSGPVVVETVHEALFRTWTPLTESIKASEAELRTRSELTRLAQEWNARGNLDSYLIGAERLEAAQRFLAAQAGTGDLDLVERFVRKSQLQQTQREEQVRQLSEEARAERTRARIRARAEEAVKTLDARPTRSLVLAIDAVGQNLQELPGEMIGPVRNGLRRALDRARERQALVAHVGGVTAVATSPIGDLLVSAGNDGTVRVWDAEGNPIGQPFASIDGCVPAVAFSPDGQTVVSGGADGAGRLWNLDGEQLWREAWHRDSVTEVAFSPDGRWIATSSDDRTARLWDPQGQPIGRPLDGHREFVSSLAISADSRLIATTSGDGTIRLWGADREGQMIREFPFAERTFATCVAFDPDGGKLLCGGADGRLRLFDLDGNNLAICEGHDAWVTSVAFGLNGRRIVSGSADGTLRLWDPGGNVWGPPLRGHEDIVTSVSFAANGRAIVSGSADGTVRMWDSEGLLRSRFRAHVLDANGVAFVRGGEALVSVGADRRLGLWELGGGRIAEREEHANFIHAVASTTDGTVIVTGDADGKFVLWNGDGQPIAGPIAAHPGRISTVAISPDGATIASGGTDGEVRLWDLQGDRRASIESSDGAVYAVAFSPDGTTIAIGGADGTVRLCDLEGRPRGLFETTGGSLFSMAFSPDGTLMATGGSDGLLRLWDLQRETAHIELRLSIEGHAGPIYSVGFSPDGTFVASGSRDETIRLWDMQGNEIGPPMSALGSVSSVRFSPDGSLLAAASASGWIDVWLGGDWSAWLDVGCRRLERHAMFLDPGDDDEREAAETCRRYVLDGALA